MAILTKPVRSSPTVPRGYTGGYSAAFSLDSGQDTTVTDSLQSLARRYGKKKKRKFRFTAAAVRASVLGSTGYAETPTDPPSP